MIENELLYDELCLSIYNTNRYFHHLYGIVLDKYELSYLQYMALLVIYKNQSVKLMDIGMALNLSSNTLTPVIDRLIKKSWLIKHPSALDRRVKFLEMPDSQYPTFENVLIDIARIRDELIQSSTRPIESIISENDALNQILQQMISDNRRYDK